MDIPKGKHDSESYPFWVSLTDGSRKSATLVCSRGHFGALLDHTIHADGQVTPSAVCPAADCDFHEVVRLVGW